jgi:hypothetical protein
MKEAGPKACPRTMKAVSAIYSLESRRDGRANGVVNSLQPVVDENHASDTYHRNQSAYQAILDGCAGLVLEKMRAKVIFFHRASSRARAEMKNQDRAVRGACVSRRTLASPLLGNTPPF